MITLTTDFGLKDPYAAEMKAVILGISPNAVIIDITHEVAKFNVRMGAYVLSSAAPYFPRGTIHVAVVDPGVGTQRRPILIQTKQRLLCWARQRHPSYGYGESRHKTNLRDN
jgi:S-adenosylmethionine hydrolase